MDAWPTPTACFVRKETSQTEAELERGRAEMRFHEVFPEPGEAMLIVLGPTREVWEAQTGGVLCHHPAAEGTLVVLSTLDERVEQFAHALEAVHRPKNCGFGAEEAAKIQAAITHHQVPLRVKHHGGWPLEEAWCPVEMLPGFRAWGLEEYAGADAILLWHNCD